MSLEASTLYKLIVLYMLDKVDFPLTINQLSEFIIGKEYTNYFTLQQVIHELSESGLITINTIGTASYYQINNQGKETLGFFSNKISAPIIEELDAFLTENNYKFKSESAIMSDYYKSTNGDYIVHCQIKADSSPLIELNLSVSSQKIAEHMCMNWKNVSEDIYSYIIRQLN